MQSLFDFRFDNQVDGHSLGNLMLAALTLMENDFARAVERASGLLAVRGQVLPSTTEQVQLVAEVADGGRLAGETSIAAARGTIRQVSLSPSTAHALPQAKAAIAAADLVVLGPGSLYTSLIPNLLVEDIAESISKSSARVVLVMNLMTEPGETDGYSASDVLYAIHRHAPQVRIHTVLLNKTPIPEGLALRYTVEGAAPIRADIEAIEAAGCRPVERRLLGSGPFIRHDPFKLAHALLEMTEDPSS
jgi:uncharacterized cofD-like protein